MSASCIAEKIHEQAKNYAPFMGNKDHAATAEALADINQENSDSLTALMNDIYVWAYRAGVMEQTSIIENQAATLERARAVLVEVTSPIEREYMRGTFEADCFIENLRHLELLLHVVDGMLSTSISQMETAIHEAFHLREKGTPC